MHIFGLEPFWSLLLIEAVAIAACAGAVLLLRKRRSFWNRRIVRGVVFLSASAVLLFLSSTRPIDLNRRVTGEQYAPPELITMELKKANDEIQMRIGQEDTWFHYKFLLVGALLAAFGGVFKLGPKHPSIPLQVELNPATCSALALACIVATAIDIHLRNNIVVIQQLALWIANYAEPVLSRVKHGFLPWEQFLRQPGGMHNDVIYGFAFYPHLHFLTWVLYVMYLGCLQTLALRSRPREGATDGSVLAVGFVLVHIAFMAFAFVGHFVPHVFRINVISDYWDTAAAGAASYAIAAVLLAAINSYYFLRFAFPPLFSADDEQGSAPAS
jgi:hypothetical protein